MDAHHLELVDKYADIIQIGARNMQNFMLLKSLGATRKPIMLKRGMSSTIEEWLMSAEYIVSREMIKSSSASAASVPLKQNTGTSST